MYNIYSIIIFLKNQRDLGYQAVESVLALIDDKKIPDEEKKERILTMFRNAGLFEVGFTDEMPEEVQEAIQQEYEKRMARREQEERPPHFAVQIFILQLLNYNIQVGVILN